jgi:sugar/nucleoside kinase (ribokinase family)
MKLSNTAAISILGLIILAVLGWRGADVSGSVVGIVLAYAGARSGQKVGLGWAVSKDANSSTENVIEKLKD